jgi:hypothetical protein
MGRRHSRRIAWPLAVLLLSSAVSPLRAAEPAADAEFFEKRVRPVLAEHCYKCHSAQAKKLKGGLLLDSRDGLLKGGEGGPVLVPGRPEKSRLVEAIGYKNPDLQMPPRSKLPDAAIADLTAWVRMGAPWPATVASAGAAVRTTFDLEKRKHEHWAWQPVRPVGLPPVRDCTWPLEAADRFILARLEARGLAPGPDADRRTLLRRVTFDLTGLPPTPEEVEAFAADRSPDAFEKVADRLLASPHFGERWGRHWLDLVRYAESRGHEYDYPLPNAYQYRDYVIRAVNADVPYDQFVREHVAGDLLENPRRHPTEGFNESILGTGFWFLGEEVHSPVDVRQDEADRIDNRIDVLTKAFLGLTVACARCHDHKFDAISTRDYYALFGFLESCSYRLVRFDTMERERQVAAELWRLRRRSRSVIQRAVAEALRPSVDRLADYLVAARAVIRSGTVPDRRRVEEVARAHRLDAGLLDHWVAHLAALSDEGGPFYPWSRTACDPRGSAESLRLFAERKRRATRLLAGVEVVLDFDKSNPADWLPDGVLFGSGPVRPGEVHFGTDPARPIVGVYDRAAAVKDATWDCLKLAPGSETDPGALAGVVRAGRSIRTPTFTLKGGKVFYLVKGKGQAYAAVDQHALIAGPLHGRLVLSLPAGERFQWIAHDLSPYDGQLAHIEFTPAESSDFAVAMVVQAANTPPLPEPAIEPLLRLLGDEPETMAAAYQRLLSEVVERLGSDRIVGFAEAADYGRLIDWLLRHPELFPSGGKRVAAAAGPFFAEQARIVARIPKESRLALAMWDGTGMDEHVFVRGSPKAPGELVPRRFLEALAGPEQLSVARGSGRLDLARQITDPARDPFLARVMVNRVWHHLFGRGLVASVDNFGVLGEPPTHPELLDYLADRFVRDGWSVKRLIRTLVLSRTYRMSSQPDPRGDEADPQSLLLHHMPLRRLEGECIRDAMLAVSGRLDSALYGPSVPVYLTAFQDGRGRPDSGPLDGAGRRSLYLSVRRNFLSPLLLAFDMPIPSSTIGRRTVSNVPAQALILLNDPFVHQQAEVWAQRILAQDGTTDERIARMYLAAFARPPTDAEQRACRDFLNQQGRRSGERPAWADLAHVLFNAKEFLFLP